MTDVVLLVGATETTVDADASGGRLLVDGNDFAHASGWTLKPEGLCRGEVCVPVRDRDAVVVGDRIDLTAVAALLRLPLAADLDEGVVAIAEHAATEPAPATTDAPDFTLPTLSGEPFRFSAIGRKKKVLTTWASW